MGKFLVGWAEESLIPKGRKVILEGQFYERITDEVESDVTVTVLAIEADGDQLLLASMDQTAVNDKLMADARRLLAERNPEINPEKLAVAATHSHTAVGYRQPEKKEDGETVNDTTRGILNEFLPKDKQYTPLVKADEAVIQGSESRLHLANKIAIAADRAWKSRKEALYANEFGRAAVGFCRRVQYNDETAQMWGDTNSADFEALEGGNDSGIELLYFFDTEKNLTGVVANIACPSQILEHRTFLSSDYWGKAKQYLRERLGDHVYLLAMGGAGGDQCPRDLVRWVTPEQPINDPNIKRPFPLKHKADPSMFDLSGCRLAGRRIANEILSVYEEITEYKSDAPLRHKVVKMDMPLRKATITQYRDAVREIEYYVNKNKDKDVFNYEDLAAMHVCVGTIKRYREQQFAETFPIEIHVIRFGNIAIATNPFELFLDYGNRIKARSYAEQTFIMQLCCGACRYLPTEKAERHGHYSAYISSGNTGHEGGDLLVRKTLTELNEMF